MEGNSNPTFREDIVQDSTQSGQEEPVTGKGVESEQKAEERCQNNLKSEAACVIASGSGVSKAKKGAGKLNKRNKTILDNPKTLSQFDLSYEPKNICIASPTSAWVCSRKSNKIQLLKNDGTVEKSVDLDVQINGLCKHPLTGELYCTCQSDFSIRRIDVESGTTQRLFSTIKELGDKIVASSTDPTSGENTDETLLASICCTKGNNFVIGVHNKVCMYSYEGELLHTNVGCQRCIEDIFVSHGSNEVVVTFASYIMVTDMELNQKYGFGMMYGQRFNVAFSSSSAVMDDKGFILVGCPSSSEILASKGLSRVIRKVAFHTNDMTKVVQLRLQEDGSLWVGCKETNKIICLQYCNAA